MNRKLKTKPIMKTKLPLQIPAVLLILVVAMITASAQTDPKKAPALPYAKKGVAHIRAALKEAELV